jgi:asparagine synthase (glutamine-hydrolysing)
MGTSPPAFSGRSRQNHTTGAVLWPRPTPRHVEIPSSLSDELLMFADKLSRAHRPEVRLPYLDRTVVQFVERLNVSTKIRGRLGELLHRAVCKRVLLPALLIRKSAALRRTSSISDCSRRWTARSVMLLDRDSLMFDLPEPKPVRQLLADRQSGRDGNHKLLFSLAMVEQWLRGVRTAGRFEAPLADFVH